MALLLCGWALSGARAEEEAEALPELSPWGKSVNVRGTFGYKDNLLLSEINREESVFLGTGLDLTVWRLPLDGKQFFFLLAGEDIRYPQGRAVDHEQTLMAVSQFKMDLAPEWQGGFQLQYFYQDQIFDVSTTEALFGPVRVVGHGLGARPSMRWDFRKNYWLEAEGILNRQFFREPLDDYWEWGPKFTLGRDYGFKSALTVSYEVKRRAYDTREQVTVAGTVLAGRALEFGQQEVELAWRHNWDPDRRWRTTTRFSFLANDDNGPGFFDYHRYQAVQQLRYVAESWELKGEARLWHYDFLRQPVSVGDPSARRRTSVILGLRGERKLLRQLKLFAEYENERVLANRPGEDYRVNKVAAGVDWEF